MFRHPKYYKELRKRNKLAESRQPVVGGQQQSDQAISKEPATAGNQRSPGPGLKQQAIEESVPHNDIEEAQASSNKPQAASQTKTSLSSESLKHQATSVKS